MGYNKATATVQHIRIRPERVRLPLAGLGAKSNPVIVLYR